jgi:hypothetical protein
LSSQGFYCRSSFTSQDLPLEGFDSIEEYIATLPAKRRNDILQGVKKAQAHNIKMSVGVFRHGDKDFRDIYSWYFDVFRPYAATHFPNAFKYQFIEDLTSDLLGRYRNVPFVFATAWWAGKIVGGSFLRHIPCSLYQNKSSFASAFARPSDEGTVLQMYMLNSGNEPVGNFNTYLYYSLVDWCIQEGYSYFSFGRENMILPPQEYLNVLGAKRSWGTTTIMESGHRTQFVLCNREALLHLDVDYYVFHWELESYWLTYFANDENVPKVLSQWLEGDAYVHKRVYTRCRQVFSYLEKRAARWNNTSLFLCDSQGKETASIKCS